MTPPGEVYDHEAYIYIYIKRPVLLSNTCVLHVEEVLDTSDEIVSLLRHTV